MKPQDLLARLEAGYEYDPMYGELCNERDRLAAENAKLRELVRDFLDVPCRCEHCKHHTEDGECDLYLRACELGVEP